MCICDAEDNGLPSMSVKSTPKFENRYRQGSKVTQQHSYDVLDAVNLKDSSSVRCRIIEEIIIFVETVT